MPWVAVRLQSITSKPFAMQAGGLPGIIRFAGTIGFAQTTARIAKLRSSMEESGLSEERVTPTGGDIGKEKARAGATPCFACRGQLWLTCKERLPRTCSSHLGKFLMVQTIFRLLDP